MKTAATAEGRTLPLPGAPGARLRAIQWSTKGELAFRHLDAARPEVEDTLLVSTDTGVSRKTCSGQAINLEGAGGLPNATSDICREITLDETR